VVEPNQTQPVLQHFKFLSENVQGRSTAAVTSSATVVTVDKDLASYCYYISKLTDIQDEYGLSFWNSNQTLFPSLSELA
jgi:hypothetical protein